MAAPVRSRAAILLLAAVAGCQAPCRSGTLFVEVSAPAGLGADQLRVDATVGGQTFHTAFPYAGQSSASVELQFTQGYPAGQRLTLIATASQGGNDVASGSTTATLAGTCMRLSVTLSSLGGPLLCSTVIVSTLAGNGNSGFFNGTGGPNGTTQFQHPYGVAVDGAGYVYVADYNNHRIRKVALSDGATVTLAGGSPGFFNGTGGESGTTQFKYPTGVAVDGAGYVYVADAYNNRIRKVALSDGHTSTLAGNAPAGFFNGTGGEGGMTLFSLPRGVAVDAAAGYVYVADFNNNRIRKLALSDGTTMTLAGSATASFANGTGGEGGMAKFDQPEGVAVDGVGNVYVADASNYRIRKVGPDGTTATLAGGMQGFFDGTGGEGGTTEFFLPHGVAVDGDGNVYVADGNTHIRKVGLDGTTTTLAGNGTASWEDGSGCSAAFNVPRSVALFGKLLFVADTNNHRIRQIQLP